MFSSKINLTKSEQIHVLDKFCMSPEALKKAKTLTKAQAGVLKKILNKQALGGQGKCSVSKRDLASLIRKIHSQEAKPSSKKATPKGIRQKLHSVVKFFFGAKPLGAKLEKELAEKLGKHEQSRYLTEVGKLSRPAELSSEKLDRHIEYLSSVLIHLSGKANDKVEKQLLAAQAEKAMRQPVLTKNQSVFIKTMPFASLEMRISSVKDFLSEGGAKAYEPNLKVFLAALQTEAKKRLSSNFAKQVKLGEQTLKNSLQSGKKPLAQKKQVEGGKKQEKLVQSKQVKKERSLPKSDFDAVLAKKLASMNPVQKIRYLNVKGLTAELRSRIKDYKKNENKQQLLREVRLIVSCLLGKGETVKLKKRHPEAIRKIIQEEIAKVSKKTKPSVSKQVRGKEVSFVEELARQELLEEETSMGMGKDAVALTDFNPKGTAARIKAQQKADEAQEQRQKERVDIEKFFDEIPMSEYE